MTIELFVSLIYNTFFAVCVITIWHPMQQLPQNRKQTLEL